MTEEPTFYLHLDLPGFAEAAHFTAASTGFDARLVEKDYYFSLILHHLSRVDGLVFKGGTCLAKVHGGFFRLSEDLDFVVATPPDATRGWRRSRVAPLREALDRLPGQNPALRVVEPFTGANVSTQYLATLAYTSALARREEAVKIEVALREPLLLEPTWAGAESILRDPLGGRPQIAPVRVQCIALIEALAEKLRAALSRREPAIRDLFDVDWAVEHSMLDPEDSALIALVRLKLAVPGNAAVDVSVARLKALRRQVDLGLRPVLRPADFAAFDLDRAFRIVSNMAAKLGVAQ